MDGWKEANLIDWRAKQLTRAPIPLSCCPPKSKPFFSLVPVSRSLSRGILHQIFPLHEEEPLKRLRKTWVRGFISRQPFGEQIFFLQLRFPLPSFNFTFNYLQITAVLCLGRKSTSTRLCGGTLPQLVVKARWEKHSLCFELLLTLIFILQKNSAV